MILAGRNGHRARCDLYDGVRSYADGVYSLDAAVQ
jgi:hypothetical protein